MMRFLLGLGVLAACSSNHAAGPATGAPDANSGGGHDSGGAISDAGGGDAAVVVDAAPDAYVDRGVEQDYDDLATTLAAAIGSTQLQAMKDGIATAYNGGTLPGFTTVQPGELAATINGISYDYMFHCEDQQAHDNITCGPASDHIHWMATISGPVTVGQEAFSEFRMTTHWTIHEIYLNKPQVEDADTLRLDTTLASDGTRFQITTGGTFDHVRLDPQPTAPFAGGISYSLTVARTRQTATPAQRSYTATAAIAFTGPGLATITLDGTHVYDVDMSTGVVSRQP